MEGCMGNKPSLWDIQKFQLQAHAYQSLPHKAHTHQGVCPYPYRCCSQVVQAHSRIELFKS